MKRKIHVIFQDLMSRALSMRASDPELIGATSEIIGLQINWKMPGIGLDLACTPDELLVSLASGDSRVLIWNDLLKGNPMRPPILDMHSAMYQNSYTVIETSFGTNVGGWVSFRIHGFVMLTLWDSLIYFSKESRNP